MISNKIAKIFEEIGCEDTIPHIVDKSTFSDIADD